MIFKRMTTIKSIKFFIMIIAVTVMIATQIQVIKAADCNPALLASCLPAAMNPKIKASPECCTNFKAQQPCFCGYLKDPRNNFDSPGTKNIAATCGVTIPAKCPLPV